MNIPEVRCASDPDSGVWYCRLQRNTESPVLSLSRPAEECSEVTALGLPRILPLSTF